MRKAKFVLLAFILLLVMTGSGCAKNSGANKAETKESSIVTPAGTLPITKEKTTLKVLVAGRPNIDFPTSSATKWLEEQTNVHIDWQVAPEGNEAQTKLNVVLASGDYPDVIMNFGVTSSQQLSYGKQGIFIPLNQLIDKYGVETKKVFEKFPGVRNDITASDGNIYSLPVVAECYQCSLGQKMWLYKPWLDKLQLQVPTTTEQFYQVLKAFKEKDPNGNGKPDEIPLSGSIEGDHTGIDEFLLNAFVLNSAKSATAGGGFSIDEGRHMYVNKGKIEAAFVQPGWKEGLKYLHKLYAEKLIDPQALTQNKKQLKALGENKEPILGAASALSFGTFTQYGGPSNRWSEYVAVPPLEGPNGFRVAPYNPDATKTGEFIITSAAKHPDVAMRLADYLYNEDVTWKLQKGEEGVNWRKPLPGEVGANGKPALFAQLNPISEEKSNNNWYQRGLWATPDSQRYTSAVDPKAPPLQAIILFDATKKLYEPYQQKADTLIPALFMDVEQSKKVVDYSKTIGTYVNETVARFITGDLDIDKDWDSYLNQLKSMNLQKLLDIYQAAYDAKKKK